MEPNLKKDLKLNKINKKRQSTHHQHLQIMVNQHKNKNIQQKDDHIILDFIDPLVQIKKSKQWWADIDNVYYKPVKSKNILLVKNLTSSQKLINFFSIEDELQGSYQNQQICTKLPLLRENTLIHVLFKSSTPFSIQLVTYSYANYIQNFSRRNLKTLKQEKQEDIIQDINYQLTPCMRKLKSQFNEVENSQILADEALKIGNLQFQAICKDQEILYQLQKLQKTIYEMQFQEDIDIELQLWQQAAEYQNAKNSILWDQLISNHQKTIEIEPQNYTNQVSKIKQTLMHHTILRYIQHGTKDKTHEMVKQLIDSMKLLKPAKTRQANNKKFFQTDCKICFCSFNSDSNQVLYCDMCNTSFHLACYGLSEVPQQKQYFCDRCLAIKKDQKTKNNLRRITCQICCKPNFPIKQIDGHFYHMTCLILFNFIHIKEGRIQLREGLNHETIMKKVIQNQMECESCIFCTLGQGAELGMQFSCCIKGCRSSMHPICAYINGCLFDVKKIMRDKKIEVNICCNKHDYERDYIQQTYLRRYMCNFKNTSQKTLQSFRTQYQQESSSRKQKLESSLNQKSSLPKLIIDTKIIRKHIHLRQQKNTQKPQQTAENTEIRKMLERYGGQKNKI